MQAPRFWFTPPDKLHIAARLLSPIGQLYAYATAQRTAQHSTVTAQSPVICVGNLNAGGTGKTPTVIALVQLLLTLGKRPHVITKGYGGNVQGPLEVNPRYHNADQTGDEPLLLAAFATTWVAKDRVKALRAAEKAGADVIIMDDGFQDPTIRKDLSLVIVDAERGFGNAKCIPAGPLREPVSAGLARADAIVSIGPQKAQHAFNNQWGGALHLPHFDAELRPLSMGMDWSTGRYLAFAGIGHPEKFFATLRELGAQLVHCEALADHQSLSPTLLGRLQAQAQAQQAQLVTTEKDAARLPDDFQGDVITLPVRLEVHDTDQFTAMVKKAISADML